MPDTKDPRNDPDLKHTYEGQDLMLELFTKEFQRHKAEGWSDVDSKRWWFGIITATILTAIEKNDLSFIWSMVMEEFREHVRHTSMESDPDKH